MDRRMLAWVVTVIYGAILGNAHIDSLKEWAVMVIIGVLFYGVYDIILGRCDEV